MKNNGQIIKFILLAFSLYIVWFVVYDYFIEPDGRLNKWLDFSLAYSGNFILRIMGYHSDVILQNGSILMRIDSTNLLAVGDACNGLELFVLFAGFIICFPGSKINKLWFIPAGIIAIHIINSVRAAALSLNQFYHPQSLNFNHHYTFTMLVYAFMFYLWFIWVNMFAQKSYKAQTDDLSV